ncbi:MAG: DUF3330 domain-containing protein [Betaproteobacteria bacterium]|nr:DUF3330 domain-containing protein [Betaproteobacteria bacterium]
MPGEPRIFCSVCRREAPRSLAVGGEADDYVFHFCGLHCYAIWRGEEHAQCDPDVKGRDGH